MMTPIFLKCFSMAITHLMMKKILYFNCFSWIHSFNKTFWCFLISKLAHQLVYGQFVWNCLLILFCFTFTIGLLGVLFLDYFCKMIYFIRFFFLYLFFKIIMYVSWTRKNLLQILQLNNIQINIHLSDFGADFCWLIPRHTKE